MATKFYKKFSALNIPLALILNWLIPSLFLSSKWSFSSFSSPRIGFSNPAVFNKIKFLCGCSSCNSRYLMLSPLVFILAPDGKIFGYNLESIKDLLLLSSPKIPIFINDWFLNSLYFFSPSSVNSIFQPSFKPIKEFTYIIIS